MSDAIETTAAGATRAFFGALGFILLMVGVEGMTGHNSTQLFADIILCAFGTLCFYLAFFWGSAKKHISAETQATIASFAQSRVVKFGLLFLVLETLILMPFIEQHRWPFSYHAGDAEFSQLSELRARISALGPLQGDANRWRFAKLLKDGSGGVCHFQLVVKPNARSTVPFWTENFDAASWIEDVQVPSNQNLIQPGITLRIAGETSQCASALQRALTDFYPNPPSKIVANQQFKCTDRCVIVEMDY